jgi:hypothetical protein
LSPGYGFEGVQKSTTTPTSIPLVSLPTPTSVPDYVGVAQNIETNMYALILNAGRSLVPHDMFVDQLVFCIGWDTYPTGTGGGDQQFLVPGYLL